MSIKILDVEFLEDNAISFVAKIPGVGTVCSTVDFGEDLVFGELIKQIHYFEDFYSGVRNMLTRHQLAELRLALNQELRKRS